MVFGWICIYQWALPLGCGPVLVVGVLVESAISPVVIRFVDYVDWKTLPDILLCILAAVLDIYHAMISKYFYSENKKFSNQIAPSKCGTLFVDLR